MVGHRPQDQHGAKLRGGEFIDAAWHISRVGGESTKAEALIRSADPI